MTASQAIEEIEALATALAAVTHVQVEAAPDISMDVPTFTEVCDHYDVDSHKAGQSAFAFVHIKNIKLCIWTRNVDGILVERKRVKLEIKSNQPPA